MKLLVLVLVLALSGVANAAVDVSQLLGAETHEAGCPDCDDDDGPCSALCDDCVCAFGARSMPSAPPLLSAPMIVMVDGVPTLTAAAPRAPETGDVFHPPRA